MDHMNEEKSKVLRMIEEGKITAAEGLELLDALDKNTDVETEIQGDEKVKWIKVRVKSDDNKTKVKVNFPVALASIGLNMANRFAPDLKGSGLEHIDLDEILAAIKNGAEGKIAEVDDDESGNKVEIYVE